VLQTAALKLVGQTRVEETLFELGDIDSDGNIPDMKMRSGARPVRRRSSSVSSRSRRTFTATGKLDSHPKLRSERFYRLWQQETEAWLDLGTAKTALVYGMAGPKPRHAA